MADKYDDLFSFYIKLYDDEIARFRGLDTKIGRYLSAYPVLRGGSVSLNRLQAVDKWLSALVMPPPGLAWAG